MSNDQSRSDRIQKRRRTSKLLLSLVIIGILLLLFLIGNFLLGSGDESRDEETSKESNEDLVIEENESGEETEDDKNQANNEDESDKSDDDDKKDKDDDIEKESIESSDDNVTEAYKGNWDPVGTDQEGEHTTEFVKDSQDWKEMEKAASMAAGLDANNMVTWRIENGGAPDKVVATISEDTDTQTYRVYISWVDQEGWKPEKVELLKNNDKQ